MSGNQLSDTVKNQIVADILYDGLVQREVATKRGINLETVNKYWREFVSEVARTGDFDATLERRGLIDPSNVVGLTRQMLRLNMTAADGHGALPLLLFCRRVRMDPAQLLGFMEAAARFAQPGFPIRQFAETVSRIHQHEVATGIPFDALDRATADAATNLNRIQAESSRAQTSLNQQQTEVRNLQAASAKVSAKIKDDQQRLAPLDARLASLNITLQNLDNYVADSQFLKSLGFNINDPHMVSSVFNSFKLLNYDPHYILNAINNIGNLGTAFTKATSDLTAIQHRVEDASKDLQNLQEKKMNEAKRIDQEIQTLQQKRDHEALRVKQAREQADLKIAAINNEIQIALIEAQITKQQLAEFLTSREKLRQVGLEI